MTSGEKTNRECSGNWCTGAHLVHGCKMGEMGEMGANLREPARMVSWLMLQTVIYRGYFVDLVLDEF